MIYLFELESLMNVTLQSKPSGESGSGGKQDGGAWRVGGERIMLWSNKYDAEACALEMGHRRLKAAT
jgi:hypothetical protein